jgi:hypothetical protein
MNMEMKFLKKYLFIVCLGFNTSGFAKTENTPLHQPGRGHQSYSSLIQEVIQVEYEGYRSISYRVKWKGNDIIIPNTILKIKKNTGDELKFLVMWHDLETEDGTKKLLNFSGLE